MRSKIQLWGNSLALRIPKPFAEEIGLRRHSEVELSLDEGKIVVFPAAESRPSLSELLAQVTDENRHAEVDSGPPVGKEVW